MMQSYQELRRIYDIQCEVASDLRKRLAEAVKILEGHWCTKGADTNVECDVCAFLAKEKQEKQ